MSGEAIQFRRGTTAQHDSFTGLVAELTVNTETLTVHVHDGSTVAGLPLLRADLSNLTGTILASGIVYDDTTSNITAGTTQAAIEQLDADLAARPDPVATTIAGISNSTGDIGLVAGKDIAITPDAATNSITIAVDGSFLLPSEMPGAAVAQFTSRSLSTDFNASNVSVPWDTTLVGNTAVTKLSDKEIQVTEAGLWQISVNLSFTSTVARANPRVRFWINGVEQMLSAQSSYIRAASGHNSSSSSMTAVFSLNANDIIEVKTSVAGAAGTVNLNPDESVLVVNKLAGRVSATQSDADSLNGKTSGDFASTVHTHLTSEISGLGNAATRSYTVSTGSPSGGSNGDVHYQV